MYVEHQQLIAVSPSVVFALNTDIERWPALTPTITSVSRIDSGLLRVGSQARVKQPGQRVAVWTVDVLEPDRRFVWSTRMPGVQVVATHVVEVTPDGSRNTLGVDISGVVGALLGPLLRRKLRHVLATENEGFRRAAEEFGAESSTKP